MWKKRLGRAAQLTYSNVILLIKPQVYTHNSFADKNLQIHLQSRCSSTLLLRVPDYICHSKKRACKHLIHTV